MVDIAAAAGPRTRQVPRAPVVLIEHHDLVAHGLRRALDASCALLVLAHSRSAAEGLRVVAGVPRPVVVADLSLPDGGPDLVARLRAAAPGCRVLLLSAGDHHLAGGVLAAAGADAVVAKTSPLGDVVAAALSLVGAGPARRRGTRRPPGRRGGSRPLTRREVQVLEALATGASTADAASRLGISRHTLKAHLGSAMTKLGVPGRVAAVAEAVRVGAIQPPGPARRVLAGSDEAVPA